MVSLHASESVSRAIGPRLLLVSRIQGFQAATCRARLRAASGIELRKWHSAASVVTTCAAHPSCPSEQTQQLSRVRVVGFPQAHRPSISRSSVPLTLRPSVPHRAADSFAPFESVSPLLTRPSVSSTRRRLIGHVRPSVSYAVSFVLSESVPLGSQAVVNHARMPGPCLGRAPPRPFRARATSAQASGPRVSGHPSASVPGAPRATAPRHRPPAAAGPAPGHTPSTAPPGPPGADPDPDPRLRHRGFEHRPTSIACNCFSWRIQSIAQLDWSTYKSSSNQVEAVCILIYSCS